MKAEVEAKGWVVPFDGVSSYWGDLFFRDTDTPELRLKKKEARKLLNSAYNYMRKTLKSLGLTVTQSTVLVSNKRTKEEIQRAIELSQEKYKKINGKLEALGFRPKPMPLIKVIPIVSTQFIYWKELAEEKLHEQLQGIIDKLAKAVNELDPYHMNSVEIGIERSKVKALQRTISKLDTFAKELEIETSRTESDLKLAFELSNEALDILAQGEPHYFFEID